MQLRSGDGVALTLTLSLIVGVVGLTLRGGNIIFFLAQKFVKRTLSPYFCNLPLLHITIRLHLICRLLKFMQWLARKQYLLCRRTRQIGLNAVGRVKVGDNIIDL